MSEIRSGTIIEIGKYPYSESGEKKTLSWIVLETIPNKGALVVCSECIDSLPFNKIDTEVNWECCTLRNWLNREFYNQAFSHEEKQQITLACIDNSNLNPCSLQYSSTNCYGSTYDHVFLLSLAEYTFFLRSTSVKMRATPFAKKRGVYCEDSNIGNCGWWLRTPANACLLFSYDDGWWNRDPIRKDQKTTFVFCGEYARGDGNYADCPDYGVCPAMWLSIENLEKFVSTRQNPVKLGLSEEEIQQIINAKPMEINDWKKQNALGAIKKFLKRF